MNEVSVDNLVNLWEVGAVSLPRTAIQYAELSQRLHMTALSEEAAFTRSTGGLGPLYASWTRLRNLMQDEVSTRTYDNLIAAGGALKQIADDLAESDALNAKQLGAYNEDIAGIKEGNGDDAPPSHVPDAPTSGDEHSAGPGGPVASATW